MKIFQTLHRVITLIFLVALLGACSQQIQGRVFLDQNGNNVGDDGEVTVKGIAYTVTLNDSPYSSGVTETGGRYSVILDQTADEGTYCVKVDSQAIAAQKIQVVKNHSTAKFLTNDSTDSTDSSDPAECSRNALDEPVCSDVNCCEEPECDGSEYCANQEDEEIDTTEDNECPTDDSNQPICSDSRCANRPACDTDKKTIQPMQACGTPAKTTLVMNLDVPITVDYTSRVDQIDQAILSPVKLGDLIEVNITYPSSCTFDLYTLPVPFYPEGLKGLYNEITREFSLDQAVHLNVSRLNKHDKTPLGHDPLYTYTLVLKVVGEPQTEGQSYLIQPSLFCPDGKIVKASATAIQFTPPEDSADSSEDDGDSTPIPEGPEDLTT